ncbi:GNAT family N-acetyltransferase [Francisella salimarina]|uniref:GNAT family N-acetyltransferase n=1 Tax=Francisella salimarina TaxID=2599927 RepID=UPI003D81ADFC
MLKEFGVRGIIRILKIQARVEKLRRDKEFLHLIYLCTDEYCRGQGLAKQVIDYGYQQAKNKKVPLLLETSKLENISYYQKHGFSVYQECDISDQNLKIYFLRKDI